MSRLKYVPGLTNVHVYSRTTMLKAEIAGQPPGLAPPLSRSREVVNDCIPVFTRTKLQGHSTLGPRHKLSQPEAENIQLPAMEASGSTAPAGAASTATPVQAAQDLTALTEGLYGELSEAQNREAAEHLYQSLIQRYPDTTSFNLLSVYTGDGKSEIHFAAHLKSKGLDVNRMIAIDTAYNESYAPFLERLDSAKLIKHGNSFKNAHECVEWREHNPFQIHAIVSVHAQHSVQYPRDNAKEALAARRRHAENTEGMSTLFCEVDAQGQSIPYMNFFREFGQERVHLTKTTAAQHREQSFVPLMQQLSSE
jgi:hypothetical protein